MRRKQRMSCDSQLLGSNCDASWRSNYSSLNVTRGGDSFESTIPSIWHSVTCELYYSECSMIITYWWRYRMNASLDQQPKDFTKLNGTPHSRNSSVPPIWIPCPLRLSLPSDVMIALIWSMNAFLANGQMPLAWLYANRWSSSGGSLTQVVLKCSLGICDTLLAQCDF